MAGALPKIAIVIGILGSLACTPATPTQPATAAQPHCSLTTYPENDRIAGWSVDKFTGRYSDGANTLTVRRDRHRLMVDGWVLGTRELTAKNVESWTWTDGCGLSYSFILRPDGPGAWLKVTMPDGRTTDWHR